MSQARDEILSIEKRSKRVSFAILPCHESNTFALQINVNNKHWVLLRIYCLQLARRFVTNRLPDPYNDWDKGWHIAHPTKILQQSNSYDCGLCCIIMTAYNAAGIDAPSSIDSKLYRLFLLALGTNVNFVHVASRGGQYSTEEPESEQ
ncbi:hypothetical protein F5883DRAFT_619815 [Diaporthe sp. PMI_573]|nr:hypothetical protein F5883DRAFT_619815 [Diaporthaceae sp. PMI_573]